MSIQPALAFESFSISGGLSRLGNRLVYTLLVISSLLWHSRLQIGPANLGARERERDSHYVHSASLAYEDGIVFMSERDLLAFTPLSVCKEYKSVVYF